MPVAMSVMLATLIVAGFTPMLAATFVAMLDSTAGLEASAAALMGEPSEVEKVKEKTSSASPTGETEGVSVMEPVRLGVVVAEPDRLGVVEAAALRVGVMLTVELDEGVPEGDGVAEMDGSAPGDRLDVGVAEGVAVTLLVTDDVGVFVGVCEIDDEGDAPVAMEDEGGRAGVVDGVAVGDGPMPKHAPPARGAGPMAR